MNKKIISVLLIVLMLGLSACSSKNEAKDNQVTTGVNVSVYEVQSGSIDSAVSYTGTLNPTQSVSVSSKVSAKANSVSVKEGDYVNAGDVLVTLDATDIRLSYEQAKAAYDSAVAGYNSVLNSSSKQQTAQAEQAVLSAQTAYDQAKINYDREKLLYENGSQLKIAQQSYNDAKSNYDRMKQLFDMGGASQLELDSAYTALVSAEGNYKTADATASASFDGAKSALTNAENALKNAKQNLELTKTAVQSSIATANASVNSAKASLNIAANGLENTTVTAPISGYVSKCNASAGQMVGAGTVIAEIKNTNMVDAEIHVTETVVPFVTVGTEAEISVSSADIENLKGSVSSVNPVKDDRTGLYTVKISIDNADGSIKAGMLADITLTTQSASGIVKIPSDSLINDGGKYYVYLAKGGKAVKRDVTVGITDGVYTEITKGISVGDSVVVDGKEYLSETNNEINVTENFKQE